MIHAFGGFKQIVIINPRTNLIIKQKLDESTGYFKVTFIPPAHVLGFFFFFPNGFYYVSNSK